MLTVRLTETQDEILSAVATVLGRERADLARAALDYWLTHGPEADLIRPLLKRKVT
jgi:hypothetical protein